MSSILAPETIKAIDEANDAYRGVMGKAAQKNYLSLGLMLCQGLMSAASVVALELAALRKEIEAINRAMK